MPAQFTVDSGIVPVVDSYTSAVVNLAASTNDQIVIAAPGAGKQIWVYALQVMADTAAGTLLLHHSVSLTGTMAIADEGGFAWPPSGDFAMPWLKVPTNTALLASTGACTIDGIICYAIVDV